MAPADGSLVSCHLDGQMAALISNAKATLSFWAGVRGRGQHSPDDSRPLGPTWKPGRVMSLHQSPQGLLPRSHAILPHRAGGCCPAHQSYYQRSEKCVLHAHRSTGWSHDRR